MSHANPKTEREHGNSSGIWEAISFTLSVDFEV